MIQFNRFNQQQFKTLNNSNLAASFPGSSFFCPVFSKTEPIESACGHRVTHIFSIAG